MHLKLEGMTEGEREKAGEHDLQSLNMTDRASTLTEVLTLKTADVGGFPFFWCMKIQSQRRLLSDRVEATVVVVFEEVRQLPRSISGDLWKARRASLAELIGEQVSNGIAISILAVAHDIREWRRRSTP